MTDIPPQLIKSLTSLGLLESEAKVYAALVALKSAEVKDLLEFLDVSKPRIYDGLRMLEESGLIVLTSPRPVTYQAIAPAVALEMIANRHNAAKDDAVRQFRELESRDIAGKTSDPIWFIFGNKSFEFKIRDMLTGAKESVYCITSEKNLGFLDTIQNKKIKLTLLVISDERDMHKKLESLFDKNNGTIGVIGKDSIGNLECVKDAKDYGELAEIAGMVDADNYFVLVVDNAEALFVPPLSGDSANAISLNNKAMVRLFMHLIEKENFARQHNK